MNWTEIVLCLFLHFQHIINSLYFCFYIKKYIVFFFYFIRLKSITHHTKKIDFLHFTIISYSTRCFIFNAISSLFSLQIPALVIFRHLIHFWDSQLHYKQILWIICQKKFTPQLQKFTHFDDKQSLYLWVPSQLKCYLVCLEGFP